MRKFWRTLLSIALCMQMTFAAWATVHTTYQHDDHHHSAALNTEAESPLSASIALVSDVESGHVEDTNCIVLNHCAGSHLTALISPMVQILVALQSNAFGSQTDCFTPTSPVSDIERPKWG